jgi:vacuolar-type H+-ATPase subunit H
MNYKTDAQYKQYVENIELEVNKLIDQLKENKDEYVGSAKEKQEELQTVFNKQWEHVTHLYHDAVAYLKDKFGKDYDEILDHKLKSAVHQAKEVGYDLKHDYTSSS